MNELAAPSHRRRRRGSAETLGGSSMAGVNLEESLERRTSGRVPFGAVLGIREYHGALPDADQFRPVQAIDLSQTGISFRTEQWPRHDSLVVMLGSSSKPSYAVARVVECQSRAASGNQRQFDVRCEFEQWIS